MPPRLVQALLVWFSAAAQAVHYPDNDDGTYSNPVMMNGHWSDPDIVRVGASYFVVTSSIETSPNLQILQSGDLVNWRVIGSVLRFWPTIDPNVEPGPSAAIQKKQCWSPRIMHINGRFRVMWHATGDHFMVAEAEQAAGPWAILRHNLTKMSGTLIRGETGRPAGPQWAATTFVDTDGKTFIYANNWIQECDAAALNWVGFRNPVANPAARGVGMMENPSLMKRGEFYYWHESDNGTVTWGLSPDPNGGPGSTNKGALSVWRSRSIMGPWDGPRHVITSNVDFSCVNTGSVVLGPDNVSWYYVYDAIEVRRWNLQRQMMLDKIEFDEDEWPRTITPSRKRPMPVDGQSTSERWHPQLSDEFNSTTLEGISSGVLGSKWLFKQEDPSLWSLESGALILKTNCSGIETVDSANMLVQRPTSSYFTIETKLSWVGPCGAPAASPSRSGGSEALPPQCDAVEHGVDYMNDDIMPDSKRLFLDSPDDCCAACHNNSKCIYWSYITNDTCCCQLGITCGRCYFKTNDEHRQVQKGVVSGHIRSRIPDNDNASGSGSAGIIAREFNSGSSAAIGVFCDASAGGLRLALWQDTVNLLWTSAETLSAENTEVYLRLDIDLVRAEAWWKTNETAPWQAFSDNGMPPGFQNTATRLIWELVHVGPRKGEWPSHGVPDGGGGEGGKHSTANQFKQADSFTTMHPGLFAGGGTHAMNAARFDYWRYTDNEVFAT